MPQVSQRALASLMATVDLMVQTSLLEQGRMFDELKVRHDSQAKELESGRLRNSEAVLIARRNALGLGLAVSRAGLAAVGSGASGVASRRCTVSSKISIATEANRWQRRATPRGNQRSRCSF